MKSDQFRQNVKEVRKTIFPDAYRISTQSTGCLKPFTSPRGKSINQQKIFQQESLDMGLLVVENEDFYSLHPSASHFPSKASGKTLNPTTGEHVKPGTSSNVAVKNVYLDDSTGSDSRSVQSIGVKNYHLKEDAMENREMDVSGDKLAMDATTKKPPHADFFKLKLLFEHIARRVDSLILNLGEPCPGCSHRSSDTSLSTHVASPMKPNSQSDIGTLSRGGEHAAAPALGMMKPGWKSHKVGAFLMQQMLPEASEDTDNTPTPLGRSESSMSWMAESPTHRAIMNRRQKLRRRTTLGNVPVTHSAITEESNIALWRDTITTILEKECAPKPAEKRYRHSQKVKASLFPQRELDATRAQLLPIIWRHKYYLGADSFTLNSRDFMIHVAQILRSEYLDKVAKRADSLIDNEAKRLRSLVNQCALKKVIKMDPVGTTGYANKYLRYYCQLTRKESTPFTANPRISNYFFDYTRAKFKDTCTTHAAVGRHSATELAGLYGRISDMCIRDSQCSSQTGFVSSRKLFPLPPVKPPVDSKRSKDPCGRYMKRVDDLLNELQYATNMSEMMNVASTAVTVDPT